MFIDYWIEKFTIIVTSCTSSVDILNERSFLFDRWKIWVFSHVIIDAKKTKRYERNELKVEWKLYSQICKTTRNINKRLSFSRFLPLSVLMYRSLSLFWLTSMLVYLKVNFDSFLMIRFKRQINLIIWFSLIWNHNNH